MNDRATMRMSRRGNPPADAVRVIHPRGSVQLPTQASRVRDVVGHQGIPTAQAASPVAGTGTTASRTAMRPVEPPDPMLSTISTGFERLHDSIDGLTRAIRQANGLDAADEELSELRNENASLQAQVANLTSQLEQMLSTQTVADPAAQPSAVANPEPPTEPDAPA